MKKDEAKNKLKKSYILRKELKCSKMREKTNF